MHGLMTFLAIAFGFQPVAAAPPWEPAIPGVPPDIRPRGRADKEYTTILVKLNGKYLTESGQPFKSMTDNPADLPHWIFVETNEFEVPVSGLAPGVHHLEIRRGIKGSSLPLVNEHDIWFSVGE